MKKTEEEKKKDFAKYWVKTFEMMEAEDDAAQKLFGEDLEGLQKTVTISVKDFREMNEKDKARFVVAAIKEMNSLINRQTFTRLTRKQCHDRYWRNGIKTKNLPSKVVLTKKT